MALCECAGGKRVYRSEDQESCIWAKKTTLPPILWPLMRGPSLDGDRCCVCGSRYHLNRHHVVRRGAGEVFASDGRKLAKPTLTLCGQGNTEGCHGEAHQGRLHFRFTGVWEYLRTDPMDYATALEQEGWREVGWYR